MNAMINDTTVLFVSILLEAFPFVLLGSFISSLIGVFVSDELFRKLIPKNRVTAFFAVALMGILFPVCDCTIIPIMRRLIKKGLAPSLAVTFMCAVPIVNPSVLASTAWAFSDKPYIIGLRMLVGIFVAILGGMIVGRLTRNANPLLDAHEVKTPHGCSCGHNHGSEHDSGCDTDTGISAHAPAISTEESPDDHAGGCCGHLHTDKGAHHHTSQQPSTSKPLHSIVPNKIRGVLRHTTQEFIDSASLIVLGAFLSAAIQMLVPRAIMYPVSTGLVSSVAAMMGFTWLISLCSNADAFVAKSFTGLFTTGSVVIFMTFGQMVDLKNTIVLLGFFRKRFVGTIIAVIAILSLVCGVVINLWGGVL